MKKVILKIEHLKKSFGEKNVIKDFDLDVYEGEFLTLLGSSGSGKTTILRSIAGLDSVKRVIFILMEKKLRILIHNIVK